MKTLIYLTLFIAWVIYLSEPTISFKPFSVEFAKPYIPFAWSFLILAIILFQIQTDKIAYKRGVNDTIEIIEQNFKNN
jgi:hypothetical protein